jgi:large subunit ribosomal protein L35
MAKTKKNKIKTIKAVRRRIKVSGTGKLMRRHSFNRHLKAGKTKSRVRGLKRSVTISGSFEKKLKQLLGLSTQG